MREVLTESLRFASGDYFVGDWRFRRSAGELERRGRRVRLEPKVAAVLGCLVEHAGEVVGKETLIGHVWPDTHVTDSALFRHVSELRRALGDDARQPRFIETVPKRGYRLTAAVVPVAAPVVRVAAPVAPLRAAVVPPVASPQAARVRSAASPARLASSTDRPIASAGRGGSPARRAILAAAAVFALVALAWAGRPAGGVETGGERFGPGGERSSAVPWAPGDSAAPGASPGAGDPRHTDDPVAEETLLFAQLFEDRVDCGSYAKALDLLHAALARDAGFVRAYETVIDVSVAMTALGCSPTRPTLRQLEATLQQARSRGLGAAEYHRALGHLRLWGAWEPRAAADEFARARALAPPTQPPDIGHATVLAVEGRLADGTTAARRVLREEPTHPGTNWALGMMLYLGDDLDATVEQLRHTLELHPGFAPAQNLLALAYLRQDDVARALETIGPHHDERNPFGDRFASAPALVYAAAGDRETAELVRQAWERRAADGWVPPTAMALLYLGLGQRERAIEWLRAGVAEGDAWCVMLAVDPTFETLRGDAAFDELLATIAASALPSGM